MKLLILLVILCLCGMGHSFIPASALKSVLFKLDGRFSGNLGKVSDTKTHDEITKEGLIQSVVHYFYDQPGGSSKINLTKMNDYYDIRRLYFDYYGKGLCYDDIPFKGVLDDIEKDVASIDFNKATADLPYAHFDAEKFSESNERVMEYIRQINFSVKYNDFEDARKKSGQILHTIQDFYSHSNWIESNQYPRIQELIGTPAFDSLATSRNRPNVCTYDTPASTNSKCKLIEEECGYIARIIAAVLNTLGLAGEYITCPLKYYDCKDNILILDVLVSGYYTGQETNDGLPVEKPSNENKCSHGGILDGSSFIEAKGGINKDSGYTLFSPHAGLHENAAKLAIKHTKKFFDDIRFTHEDKFARFLDLLVDQETLDKVGNLPCSGSMVKFNLYVLSSFLIITFFMRLY